MTLLILFFITLLLSAVLMNNLAPSFSLRNSRLHIIPIAIILTFLTGIFISKLLIADPNGVSSTNFSRLQPENTAFNLKIIIDNVSIMSGVIMALLFSFHIIALLLSINQLRQPSLSIIHQLNIIYALIFTSLLFIIFDNFLTTFLGMILLSGTGLYQNLLINKNAQTRYLIPLFLADLIFLLSIFIIYKNTLSFTISDIDYSTFTNTGNLIGLLLIFAMLSKIAAFFIITNNVDSGSFQKNLLFLEILAIFMLFFFRLNSVLSAFTLNVLWVVGIFTMIIPAILSLSDTVNRTVFRQLLLAQFGLFLIILDRAHIFNSAVYLYSFVFANILLLFAYSNLLHSKSIINNAFPMFKSGHTWLLLLAVLYVTGLLPGSGFIPRINLISEVLQSTANVLTFWIKLVFIGLGSLLFSIAVFRYFFLILPGSEENQLGYSVPNLITGIPAILNIYLVFILPHINPFTQNSWLYRVIPSTYLSPAYDNVNIAYPLGMILGTTVCGFIIGLLTYRFTVIQAASLEKLFRPIHILRDSIVRFGLVSLDWITTNISAAGTTIRNFETSITRQYRRNAHKILKWFTAAFINTDQRLTYPKAPGKLIKQLSLAVTQPVEKFEILIPGILIVALIVMLLFSII